MNDFTKIELEYIAEAIEMWFKDYDSETPERIYLKVKSMIDNYCEHNEIKIEEEKPHMKYTCINCNKIIFEM